jgi:hypothetical protein
MPLFLRPETLVDVFGEGKKTKKKKTREPSEDSEDSSEPDKKHKKKKSKKKSEKKKKVHNLFALLKLSNIYILSVRRRNIRKSPRGRSLESTILHLQSLTVIQEVTSGLRNQV